MKNIYDNNNNNRGGSNNTFKLRKFQIEAAKLICDRLVKIAYKSFTDIKNRAEEYE